MRESDIGKGTLRPKSPYAARIKVQWAQMREAVIAEFPVAPGLPGDPAATMRQVKAVYQQDAYHSLSIEGYEVTPELVMCAVDERWNPVAHQPEADRCNALAAKGYAKAFAAVCASLESILAGAPPAAVVRRDLHGWYQALFSPSVQAGILRPEALAGYRNDQVYLRGSAHVPPPKEALPDALDAFLDCLSQEPIRSTAHSRESGNPASIPAGTGMEGGVAALLGHFFFVFIHPYMDGNGRTGRFLMNVLLVAAGYPWTIVRSEQPRRHRYMRSLEQASVKGDILPFAQFIAEEMAVEW